MIMKRWYEKFLSIYGKSLEDVPEKVLETIKKQLAVIQSNEPLVTIAVIAYNEEKRLPACLWSLSELKTKYPIEILGVNNNSKDQTEKVYQRLGLIYYNETKQSPGYARQCGLDHAKGKYLFCVDADTFYPPKYIDLMMDKLQKPKVSCLSAFWSFYPDEKHSALGLHLFEFVRDAFLWFQHFKRPELCVRGMVFAFKVDYARQVKIRTDIRRGEDGSLALSLKKYGKISFLYNRQARPVTGYGTLNEESLWRSFLFRMKTQMKGIFRIFYKKNFYEDSPDNLIS